MLCDEELQNYYSKFGMAKATGSFLRNYERQNCENEYGGQAMEEFLEDIKGAEPLGEEFDNAINQGTHILGELYL